MTAEQAELLRLGIPIDDTTCLYIESALLWVLENTTYEFDLESDDDLAALPSNVKLFALKFSELMSRDITVASESIEGLSQSFNTGTNDSLIWELAESLLSDSLKSAVSFYPAKKRWKR